MDEETVVQEEVVVPDVVEVGPVVEEKPLSDQTVMNRLRMLAMRASLGKTPKMPLVYPGDNGEWEPIPDDRFYIVFNDATAQATDAFRDALEQYRQVGEYELDETTGEMVGESAVERHNRAWPLIEVVLEFKLVADACLPQFDGGGDNIIAYRWKGSKALDRQALLRGGIALVATLAHMAAEHVMGSEDRRVVDSLGE